MCSATQFALSRSVIGIYRSPCSIEPDDVLPPDDIGSHQSLYREAFYSGIRLVLNREANVEMTARGYSIVVERRQSWMWRDPSMDVELEKYQSPELPARVNEVVDSARLHS